MNSVSLPLVICFCLVSSQEWANHIELDSNYEVRWSVEGDWITFQVEVATRGWVGFGISPNGGMAGSDIVIGWVSNGRTIFHDRHAEGKFQPIIDEQQNWELLWSFENDTHTTLRFNRLLITCDDHDLPITDETTRLIYAYHSDDPASANTVMYHGAGRRGSRSILLKKIYKTPRFYETPNERFWDITSPNVRLPDDKDTQYYCTLVKPPRMYGKNHIIGISPLIQAGHEKLVHHIVVYECIVTEKEIQPFMNDDYHECYDKDNIPIFRFCLTPILGWAVGAGDSIFPENVGMPIGTPGLTWYLLEVHYDNPGLQKGIFDNSGLRITYTPKLRQHDSSILSIGTLAYPCFFVPPKQSEFVISGHGHPSCFRQRIPPQGITAFSTLLHSHTIGKIITLRHFRGDKELQPLSRDRNYDFNYQEYRDLPEERIILPSDHIIVECTYDSSERTKPTYGGFPTNDEMCVAFIGYYPKINITAATSCPSPTNVLKAIGVKQISDDERFLISPITGRNESYYDFLDSYPWDQNSVKAVQRAMKYSPHLNFCVDRGGRGIMNPILSRYPRVRNFYKEPNLCGNRSPPKPSKVRPTTTKTPQNGYPPRTRPSTRRPQIGFPPRRQKPQDGYPIRGQKPQDGFPPRRQKPQGFPPRRQKPQDNFPPTSRTTTIKPTTKIVPHVLPYPLIDQMIMEALGET